MIVEQLMTNFSYPNYPPQNGYMTEASMLKYISFAMKKNYYLKILIELLKLSLSPPQTILENHSSFGNCTLYWGELG